MTKNELSAFHYAFKVKDLETTRTFYIDILCCTEGRSSNSWIDFDFFGNQLSAHLSEDIPDLDYCGQVDGIKVPIPHFGCIISEHDFDRIQKILEKKHVEFIIEPQIRYKGQNGEHKTMFFTDPSGNPIELKAFTDYSEVFKQ
jgi:hypothetical protein